MLTPEQIDSLYAELESEHAKHLKKHDVVLPPLRKGELTYNLRALQLVYLYSLVGQLVSKQDLSDFVRSYVGDAATDQQPRHLKYGGWDVRLAGKARDTWIDGNQVPNGFNGLAQILAPSPSHSKNQVKRLGRLAAGDWSELCDAFEGRCAVCGAPTPSPERGHKNPLEPDTLDNLLPMCGACNNWASNDLIFNDQGRVAALATPKLVLNSPKAVQIEILRALKKSFKG